MSVHAIARGADIEEVRVALAGARADRDAAVEELGNLEALPVVALHPAVAQDYRAQIAVWTKALTSDPDSRLEVVPKIRALIERVVIVPAQGKRSLEISIEGRLAAILALAN